GRSWRSAPGGVPPPGAYATGLAPPPPPHRDSRLYARIPAVASRPRWGWRSGFPGRRVVRAAFEQTAKCLVVAKRGEIGIAGGPVRPVAAGECLLQQGQGLLRRLLHGGGLGKLLGCPGRHAGSGVERRSRRGLAPQTPVGILRRRHDLAATGEQDRTGSPCL